MIGELNEVLPCLEGNENHSFYKGSANIHKNNCIERKKCEYTNPRFLLFLEKHFSDFALERCCDIELSSKSQPEAILVNKKDQSEKIVIEVKDLFDIYFSDKKKDDREKTKRIHYVDSFIDRIGELVYELIEKWLDEKKITLPEELSELIFRGLLVSVNRVNEKAELNGKEVLLRMPSVRNEVLSLSPKEEEKLIGEIVVKVVCYLMHNIKACLRGQVDEYLGIYEFQIGKLYFRVGKSYEESLFSFQYMDEPVHYRNDSPEKQLLESRVREFYEHCNKKFTEFNSEEYKRILLIINKNRYNREKLEKKLSDIEPPGCIDEVWISHDEKEEVWNDKKGDFDREIIVDVSFSRVF